SSMQGAAQVEAPGVGSECAVVRSVEFGQAIPVVIHKLPVQTCRVAAATAVVLRASDHPAPIVIPIRHLAPRVGGGSASALCFDETILGVPSVRPTTVANQVAI